MADAHRGIDDASLLAFVSGSTVDDLIDELSDVDMSVVFARLPGEAVLREACRRAASGPAAEAGRVGERGGGEGEGEGEWAWTLGNLDHPTEGGVVSFRLDGIEVQIGYATEAGLAADIDDLLVRHNPDTPNHKLAEGIDKALPLAGAERLRSLQARLAHFPDGLARAMVEHGLNAKPTHWRAARQIIHRDAPLWSREIQVEACYGLLLVLCGLNRRWFTRFQVKRMRRLAQRLPLAPANLVPRIEQLLSAPPREGFDALHALEAEVLALVAAQMPEVDLAPVRRRHLAYSAGVSTG
ncbi:MAG: hypothetical protein HZC37_16660 [Burkholderiales bacterium]|nr:hypothetical protein [Burkholderiales bacterium]